MITNQYMYADECDLYFWALRRFTTVSSWDIGLAPILSCHPQLSPSVNIIKNNIPDNLASPM